MPFHAGSGRALLSPAAIAAPDDLPSLPGGFSFLVDIDGAYILDVDGAYLIVSST